MEFFLKKISKITSFYNRVYVVLSKKKNLFLIFKKMLKLLKNTQQSSCRLGQILLIIQWSLKTPNFASCHLSQFCVRSDIVSRSQKLLIKLQNRFFFWQKVQSQKCQRYLGAYATLSWNIHLSLGFFKRAYRRANSQLRGGFEILNLGTIYLFIIDWFLSSFLN